MVDPATGFPSIQRLLDQYDKMSECMVTIKLTLQKLSDRMDEMCGDKQENKEEHEAMSKRMDGFDERLDKLLSWGKALGIVASVAVVVLAVLNYVS